MKKKSIGEHIESYIQLQRSLGKSFSSEAKSLRMFERYLASRGHRGPVTQELAIAFSTDPKKRSQDRCWHLYNTIRYFAYYLAVFVPGTSTLDPRAIRRLQLRPVPFIFNESDMKRLLTEARNPIKSQISAITHTTIFGLAVSTGLRVAEVVNLKKGDVELDESLLQIRKTKFRKSRIVPIHQTTVEMLRKYIELRERAFGGLTCDAFFISTTRKAQYLNDSLCGAFALTAKNAGIRRPDGKPPTFHSLRHTFAVNRLIQWYREGVDVQAMLPVLATYMGHVNYTSTAYYLTATPELLVLAAERAAKSFAERSGHE